jgi:AcrR family transcriptional regulator
MASQQPNQQPTHRRQLPPRRTQAERREKTRAKLLEATIQCLLEAGYAGTTSRRVAELAGVSQGAQTHHFPRRVDLVGAAVERLATRRIAELRELATRLPAASSERVPALLDLFWGDFSSPLFTVIVKLWVAAADDRELYDRLILQEQRLSRAISAAARELGGELVERPEWTSTLLLAFSAIRGLALAERFEPHAAPRRDAWPDLRATLQRAFECIPSPAP